MLGSRFSRLKQPGDFPLIKHPLQQGKHLAEVRFSPNASFFALRSDGVKREKGPLTIGTGRTG